MTMDRDVRPHFIMRTARRLLPAVLLLTLGACTAEWSKSGEKKRKTKISYTVNREAWRYLDKAQKALAERDLEAAKEKLDEMRGRERRFNPYEVALMWQTYAHLYAEEENLAGATNALEKALEGETLPEGTLIDSLYNLGSLHVATEQFKKGAATFTRWLELAGDRATPNARFTVGVAFAQAKQYDKALEQAEIIVASKDNPPESWLQLLLSVQFERGDKPAVEAVLKRLLLSYPRKIYWQQLAALYSEQKEELKALAVVELMHAQDLLVSGDELTRLAQMLLFHGVPTKATSVITRALKRRRLKRDEKTLELLATSYLYARESDEAKGILAEAARKSQTGKLFIELGRQQLRDAEWDAAAVSVRRGIGKGGLKKLGDAYVLLGSIHFNAEQWSEALTAFRQAAGHPETKTTAARWQAATEQQIKNARAQRRALVQ